MLSVRDTQLSVKHLPFEEGHMRHDTLNDAESSSDVQGVPT
jgi:hypothetical protein